MQSKYPVIYLVIETPDLYHEDGRNHPIVVPFQRQDDESPQEAAARSHYEAAKIAARYGYQPDEIYSRLHDSPPPLTSWPAYVDEQLIAAIEEADHRLNYCHAPGPLYLYHRRSEPGRPGALHFHIEDHTGADELSHPIGLVSGFTMDEALTLYRPIASRLPICPID